MARLLSGLYSFFKKQAWLLSLIFCFICVAVILFVKIKLTISYLPDISGSERSTTYGIQLVADGRPLYYNPEEVPFWVTQYAPIYYLLVGNLYKLTGWDPSNIHQIQLLSRIVSFGLVLLSMGVTFLTARRLLRFTLTQTLLLCCVIFGLLQHWHLTNSRIDSLLFLCTTVYLYCALQGTGQQRLWNRYFQTAALLAVTAFFIKQSGMIHIAVLLAFLVISGDWRTLFRTAGLMVVAFTILTLLLDEGNIRVFFQNLFISLELPLSAMWFYDYTFRHLIPVAIVLIAVSFLVSLKWLFTANDPRRQFLALSTFMFFGFAGATAFKHGAAVGYFHEFAYTGLLVIFWYFCDAKAVENANQLRRYLFPALVSMTMLFFASKQIESHLSTDYGHYALAYRDQLIVKKYIEPQLAKRDYMFVSFGDDYRGWMLQQMLFRNQLAYTDDIIRFLYLGKKYDFGQLQPLVKQGSVKFIITPTKQPLYFYVFDYTFSPKDYVLEKEISGYHIYKHI